MANRGVFNQPCDIRSIMTATTLEKSIFIVLGLAIVSIVGIPLINLMRDAISNSEVATQFNTLVNTMESGVRIVEENASINYTRQVMIPSNLQLRVAPDAWSVDVVCNSSSGSLEKTIFFEQVSPLRGV